MACSEPNGGGGVEAILVDALPGAAAHLLRPQPAEPAGYFPSVSIFAAKMKSASTRPSILCVQMVISTLPQVK